VWACLFLKDGKKAENEHVIYLQTVRDRKILEVHVDKGMVDGQKITFGGEGDQEPGLEPGDIIIVLDEKEHEMYK
jgi:DnaJ family protein A protein 1